MSRPKQKYRFRDIAWRDLTLIPIVIILMFALMIPIGVIAGLYFGPLSLSQFMIMGTVAQLIAYILMILIFYYYHINTIGARFRAGLHYLKKHWLFLIITYAIGYLALTLYEYLMQFLPKNLQYGESQNELALDQLFNDPIFLPCVFLLIVIVGPIVEEIIFRNILIGELGKKFNFIVMSIISAIVFALIHVSSVESPFVIGPYLILGILLVFVYMKAGRNLAASVTIHMLHNCISFIITVATIYIF